MRGRLFTVPVFLAAAVASAGCSTSAGTDDGPSDDALSEALGVPIPGNSTPYNPISPALTREAFAALTSAAHVAFPADDYGVFNLGLHGETGAMQAWSGQVAGKELEAERTWRWFWRAHVCRTDANGALLPNNENKVLCTEINVDLAINPYMSWTSSPGAPACYTKLAAKSRTILAKPCANVWNRGNPPATEPTPNAAPDAAAFNFAPRVLADRAMFEANTRRFTAADETALGAVTAAAKAPWLVLRAVETQFCTAASGRRNLHFAIHYTPSAAGISYSTESFQHGTNPTVPVAERQGSLFSTRTTTAGVMEAALMGPLECRGHSYPDFQDWTDITTLQNN